MQQSAQEMEAELHIIRRAKDDPSVFGLLYEKYHPAIFLFIERRIGDADTAGDLASQVFLKAMLSLGNYQFRGVPFSAFLYRIASNQINEFYRSTQKERVISLDEAPLQRFLEDASPEKPISDALALLQILLQELEEEEVQMLELRFFEERSFKEVAFILNITENNAKVRAHRIVEKLRKIAQRKNMTYEQ
jgi:RNA polymerase sigma-70 factor (ECF subfamily)